MGTHNAVMKLNDNTYFEIIAIDPNQGPPDRPRWFSMDNSSDRLATLNHPRLITWVVNTSSLDECIRRSSYPYPAGFPMSRETKNGRLEWLITVAEDGTLPAGGLLPTLIQWKSPHPAAHMPELGCRLESITIFHHNTSWLAAHLESINCHEFVTLIKLPANSAPYFEVVIRSPKGMTTLRSAY